MVIDNSSTPLCNNQILQFATMQCSNVKLNNLCRRLLSSYKTSDKYVGVVGLEVHAQILSSSKLFSGASSAFGAPSNANVAYFDAAIPGTLPVLNKRCAEAAILTAVALNCKIHTESWFDRKHYFYPDLPTGYQITQQRYPFATEGKLEFHVVDHRGKKQSYLKVSRIKQIQLEQDSGKSLHNLKEKMSLVDLNRAGVPLMEIVFEPDLANGEEAACLIKELILILRSIQTCNCKLAEGSIRVDANISVRDGSSEELGVRTEVKNISSIRGVAKAIEYEIARQKFVLNCGDNVANETRAWDTVNGVTTVMRDKEILQDYRFMPEPNLPPLRISLEANSNLINVPEVRKMLPELPSEIRGRLSKQYYLNFNSASRITCEPVLLEHFIGIMQANPTRNPAKVSTFLMIQFLAALYKEDMDIESCESDPREVGEVFDLAQEEIINTIIVGKLCKELITGNNIGVMNIIKENNWFQINDEKEIIMFCEKAIEYNPECVKNFKKKKLSSKMLQKLMNEVIELSSDRVNLKRAKKILTRLLMNQ